MNILDNKKISFIGGGNMAQAMISGLLAKGVVPSCITVADPDSDKRTNLEENGIKTVNPSTEPKAAVIDADIVVLAVKPQVMSSVVSQFSDVLESQLIVSIAAGLTIEGLSKMMDGYPTIVRAMPNTPAMIQMGASGLYAGEHMTDAQKSLAYEVLSSSGLALWVDTEEKLHAVTAVSGSAPAYFFYMIESMTEGGIKLGLSEDQASALAMQTMLGSAQMAISSEDSPTELRQKVTSPNGTTHEAIESMKSNDVGELIIKAMQACNDRSVELGNQ